MGGAERGTAHGGASETMMLVRGMYLPVSYRCPTGALGNCSLAACLFAGRSAGSLYGGVRRVGLTLRYPHFLTPVRWAALVRFLFLSPLYNSTRNPTHSPLGRVRSAIVRAPASVSSLLSQPDIRLSGRPLASRTTDFMPSPCHAHAPTAPTSSS